MYIIAKMANSIGIIKYINGDTATVDASEFNCEGCSHSEGCTLHSSPLKKEVSADINGFHDLKLGDRVELEIADRKLLILSFIMYMLPVIFLLTPTLIVYKFTQQEVLSILMGLAGLAISYLIIFVINRYQKKQFKHIIVRVIND